MSVENLEEFTRLIGQDSNIRSQLDGVTDRAIFVRTMVQVGSKNGFEFTENELKEALGRFESQFDESLLSDDQLNAVAGGSKFIDPYSNTIGTCGQCGIWTILCPRK